MADYPVFDRFRVERNTDGEDGYLSGSDNYSASIKREVRLEAHLSNTMSARINHLIDNNASPQHESLEDSFKDMANYAIIGLLVLREQWDTE